MSAPSGPLLKVFVCPDHGHLLREGSKCVEVIGRDLEGTAIFCHEAEEVEVIPVDSECESCDDTGIYEEGSEWAPCGECALGKRWAELLKVSAEEARDKERERLIDGLLSDKALHALDSDLCWVVAEDKLPLIADYRRALNAALDALDADREEQS